MGFTKSRLPACTEGHGVKQKEGGVHTCECLHMCVHVHMCAYVCRYVLVFHKGRKLNLLLYHEPAPSTMVSVQSCHVLMTLSCSSGT